MAHPHPYHPLGAALPDYVPNAQAPGVILSLFAVLIGTVCLIASKLADRAQIPAGKDRFAAMWFACCGCIHIFFEGHLIRHRDSLAGQNDLFSQAWKEYALSDSRYLLADPFVISIETITVFIWGPLCILTFLAILGKSRARHTLQAIVCVAHIYGVSLYFATETASHSLRGVVHVRPEPLYRWGYFVGANLPWLVVPLYLLRDSHAHIVKASKALEDAEKKNA